MFDEPEDNDSHENQTDPLVRAKDRFDAFRMHAELCAVFEGARKFDAQLRPNLDADRARDIQRTIARLEKSKSPDTPLLPESSFADAARILALPESAGLSTNDYHLQRRPGEVMVVRFLGGPSDAEQVESFYTRFQAHFDAALNQYREEERQNQGWKQDPQTIAYLDALDEINVKMADRYAREEIRAHKLFILSTQTADELDVLHLTDLIMGVDPADLVGKASAPPEEPTEQDRAWFFKLFALRGMHEGAERLCFFTFMQKTDDESW
jgi:hypothetical protein